MMDQNVHLGASLQLFKFVVANFLDCLNFTGLLGCNFIYFLTQTLGNMTLQP